jgi:transposase-like protein
VKSLRPTRRCYLYRAVDRHGALVDVRLSETRDIEAAKAFFRSARTVTGITPARVTTDGHDNYPRAIRSELDESGAPFPRKQLAWLLLAGIYS